METFSALLAICAGNSPVTSGFPHKGLLMWKLFPCPWWHHQMETFSALLAICAANSPVTGEFPAQRPVTQSFNDFFDLCPNKRLSKQSWGWWFEKPSRPLWRHRNVMMSSSSTWGWWGGYCGENTSILSSIRLPTTSAIPMFIGRGHYHVFVAK